MILRQTSRHVTGQNGISIACLRFLREAVQPAGAGQARQRHCLAKTSQETSAMMRKYWIYNCQKRHVNQATKSSKDLESSASGKPASRNDTTSGPNARAKDQDSSFTLPANASTTLTARAARLPRNSLLRHVSTLLSLSKPRLSMLVVLTATASYSLYPTPLLLSPSVLDAPSLSTLTLLYLTTGTALCAASANTLNMLAEPKYDALMSRTRMRPLVRGLITPRAAALFALAAGLLGVSALYLGVNPTVSFLGATNIILYAGVYTPLKRITVLNTWVGALVGAIPPLMGWAAAAGQSAATGSWEELLLGEENIGAWLLAGLLFAWQLAHFMSLSSSIGLEYKNAGYKMLAWTNPRRNARVALRYSLALLPICWALDAAGITERTFAWTCLPVNLWLVREAGRFWWNDGRPGKHARACFWASVWWLPVVLVLALVQKRGLWSRVATAIGFARLDDDYDEDEDEDEVWQQRVMAPLSVSQQGVSPRS